jgi:hypothetical protein
LENILKQKLGKYFETKTWKDVVEYLKQKLGKIF